MDKSCSTIIKFTFTLFFALELFLFFIAVSAEAAGPMSFDFENAGVAQENQYRLIDDEWELSCTKHYEYYSDGTLKTVFAEGEEYCYEGHYDPYGHLMDPTWTFYTGFVEGIMFNTNPLREYDNEGRLIRFEGLGIDIDNAEPYLIKANYEYDSQNRASRVSYSTEYISNQSWNSEPEDYMSTGAVFSYARDGSYSITTERRYGSETLYRTTFTFDKNHRLIRYDSSSETIMDKNGNKYFIAQSWLYYFDENGYLNREMFLKRDGDYTYMVQKEYRYLWTQDGLLLCDVYEYNENDDEPQYIRTVTFAFDENSRCIEDDFVIPQYHSYNLVDN